jgi:hypothetical protein
MTAHGQGSRIGASCRGAAGVDRTPPPHLIQGSCATCCKRVGGFKKCKKCSCDGCEAPPLLSGVNFSTSEGILLDRLRVAHGGVMAVCSRIACLPSGGQKLGCFTRCQDAPCNQELLRPQARS